MDITNPVKAIRAKCLDCCYDNMKEVELCPVTGCAPYPFRFGKNPYRKKVEYTEEQREEARKRMTEINAKKYDKTT